MSELVRTLQRVEPADDLSDAVRAIRQAEADLRCALDDLPLASSRIERQICIARRDRAIDQLIAALKNVGQALQRQAS